MEVVHFAPGGRAGPRGSFATRSRGGCPAPAGPSGCGLTASTAPSRGDGTAPVVRCPSSRPRCLLAAEDSGAPPRPARGCARSGRGRSDRGVGRSPRRRGRVRPAHLNGGRGANPGRRGGPSTAPWSRRPGSRYGRRPARVPPDGGRAPTARGPPRKAPRREPLVRPPGHCPPAPRWGRGRAPRRPATRARPVLSRRRPSSTGRWGK